MSSLATLGFVSIISKSYNQDFPKKVLDSVLLVYLELRTWLGWEILSFRKLGNSKKVVNASPLLRSTHNTVCSPSHYPAILANILGYRTWEER